jgi:tRNA nucleotidyltransferase/poly(A) polymerase
MSIQVSLDLMKELAQKNGLSKPYIVGGVPRDKAIQGTHELKDVDITTGDEGVHKLAKLFAKTLDKEAVWQRGHYVVYHNDIRYDFSKHQPHPQIENLLKEKGVENPTDMEKEAYSRDFTINTLMMSTDQQKIIDITGEGLKDIQQKIIRCPINCDLSFTHDPKRMLRAYNFKVRYGFEFSDDIKQSIQKNKHLLETLNRRYAAEMINKIVREDPNILDQLIDEGILQHVPITKLINKLLIKKKRLLDVMEPKSAGLPVLRKNLDYGEGWTKLVDEAREEEEEEQLVLDYLDTAEFVDNTRNRKYWKEMGDDPVAKEYQEYAKILKSVKSLPIVKVANIRGPGTGKECPFGLPIAIACHNAGNSVTQMSEITNGNEKQIKANKRVYIYHQTGERCKYADKIVEGKDRVHCDWGEAGQGMSDFPLRPSPFYPRVFQGLGQYGLYSYPINEYTDNHGARQLFTGIFSLYASTGQVSISKNALTDEIKIAIDRAITKQLIKEE